MTDWYGAWFLAGVLLGIWAPAIGLRFKLGAWKKRCGTCRRPFGAERGVEP